MPGIRARRAAPFWLAAGILAAAAGPAAADSFVPAGGVDRVSFGHPGDVPAYDLRAARSSVQAVPRLTRSGLPPALPFIDDVDRRKRVFLKSVLPAVLKANEAIRETRDFIETVQRSDLERTELPPVWRERLSGLETRYHVEPGNMDALLRRVDTVPPSLVLAQAALETGWGTSRFAQVGNALFGQHVTDPGAPGMLPGDIDDPGFKVRTFPTLEAAAAAYLNNLNTTRSYAGFREARARARKRGEDADSLALARHLTAYSVRDEAYVADIRATIRSNDLREFDDARLMRYTARVLRD